MRTLTASELLAVWERVWHKPLLERVLSLLTAACPKMDADAVAQLCIGERDTLLLQLREWMFGPRLVNTADCPRCGECVEWENRISDFTMPAPFDRESQTSFHLKVDEFALIFRLPDSNDLTAALAASDHQAARSKLLHRCIIDARHLDASCDIAALPAMVLEALSRRMEVLDPQADIRIELTCPACNHQWRILFDIASFIWTEINHWAESMILTIHKLARAYGWSEKQILDLSPMRRQLYLGLINP